MVHKKIGNYPPKARTRGSLKLTISILNYFVISLPPSLKLWWAGRASGLLLLCMGASAAQVSLTLFDDHNRSCREADVGAHYRLEARVQGATSKAWPQIAGLPADAITGRQQRQEVSWIQGKKTESTCFAWEVMFTTPGAMTIGPVSYLNDAGQTVASAPLHIIVQEHPAHATTARKATATTSTFIRWEIDQLDPFVNEVIPVRLVFYTTDANTELESISEIHLKDAVLELKQEPTWASVLHNGISYKTATWQGILSVQNPGTIAMPLVTIAYRAGASHAQSYSPWAMMHRMLNSFSQVHQKRSATLSLQVKALPPTQHTIVGVGVIHNAILDCSTTSIRCGEASTVTYRLEGSIHPNYLRLPAPQIVEASTKTYSSTYTYKGAYPSYCYEQEYVVHPQESGRMHCAQQTLWYFNPEKEAYESYIVPALEIDIQETQNIALANTTTREATTEKSEIKTAGTAKKNIPLQPVLPLSLFLLLCIAPCIIVVSKNWATQRIKRLYYNMRIRWARRVALRTIARAAHNNNGYMLLGAMRHVMHTIHDIPENISEDDFMVQSLTKRGTPHNQIQDWQALWAGMQKAAFSAVTSSEEYKTLHCKCREWINIL